MRSQRSLYAPSVPQPVVQTRGPNADNLGPFGDTVSLAVQGQASVIALVSRLLRGRGPAAIRRFVVAIGIDAVKRHARRLLAHIGKEVGEVLPSRADRDAASAVGREAGVSEIAAPRSHASPRVIRRRDSVGRVPVRGAQADRRLALQASARTRMPGADRHARQQPLRPALAATQPARLALGAGLAARKNRPPSTWLPKQINGVHRTLIYKNCRVRERGVA